MEQNRESGSGILYHNKLCKDSKVMGRFANFRIGRACPLLVVVKRLKPLTALSGTVYRLASSMSDQTPVLLNMFEDWNEESVVLHISFDSIHIRFERKRPIPISQIHTKYATCYKVCKTLRPTYLTENKNSKVNSLIN